MVREKNKIWAIIPARSGSKGIKNKNIVNLSGKPLIYYTIKDAFKSKKFEKILVLTDSQKYAKIAKSFGAEVPYLRPKSNALDTSTDNELYIYMLDFFREKNINVPNFFAHLSPTQPFRQNNIIQKGIDFFFKNKITDLSTMRSVSKMAQPAYKMARVIDGKLCSILKKDFDLNKLNYPRQSYEQTYVPNGLIDIISKKNLIVNKTTHHQKTLAFITDQIYADIDTEIDLIWAKFLISNKLVNQH